MTYLPSPHVTTTGTTGAGAGVAESCAAAAAPALAAAEAVSMGIALLGTSPRATTDVSTRSSGVLALPTRRGIAPSAVHPVSAAPLCV